MLFEGKQQNKAPECQVWINVQNTKPALNQNRHVTWCLHHEERRFLWKLKPWNCPQLEALKYPVSLQSRFPSAFLLVYSTTPEVSTVTPTEPLSCESPLNSHAFFYYITYGISDVWISSVDQCCMKTQLTFIHMLQITATSEETNSSSEGATFLSQRSYHLSSASTWMIDHPASQYKGCMCMQMTSSVIYLKPHSQRPVFQPMKHVGWCFSILGSSTNIVFVIVDQLKTTKKTLKKNLSLFVPWLCLFHRRVSKLSDCCPFCTCLSFHWGCCLWMSVSEWTCEQHVLLTLHVTLHTTKIPDCQQHLSELLFCPSVCVLYQPRLWYQRRRVSATVSWGPVRVPTPALCQSLGTSPNKYAAAVEWAKPGALTVRGVRTLAQVGHMTMNDV